MPGPWHLRRKHMLRKLTAGMFAGALIFLVLGCSGGSSQKKEDKKEDAKDGDSLGSIMKDNIKLDNEYAEVLEGIKSKDDVAKAKSMVDALQKKKNDIGERMKKQLKDVKKEEAVKKVLEVAKKYEDDGKKADDRLNKAKESVKKAVGGSFPKDLEFKPPSPQ